jgi:25S rRNA (adenine2142-N1)-methyltransferase
MLAHTMLSQGGHLFLVVSPSKLLSATTHHTVQLPLPCVQNSRYLTCEHLKALLVQIGFIEIEEKCKSGGRMAYWLFQKVRTSEARSGRVETFHKKKVLRTGKNRNNFCILF